MQLTSLHLFTNSPWNLALVLSCCRVELSLARDELVLHGVPAVLKCLTEYRVKLRCLWVCIRICH